MLGAGTWHMACSMKHSQGPRDTGGHRFGIHAAKLVHTVLVVGSVTRGAVARGMRSGGSQRASA